MANKKKEVPPVQTQASIPTMCASETPHLTKTGRRPVYRRSDKQRAVAISKMTGPSNTNWHR